MDHVDRRPGRALILYQAEQWDEAEALFRELDEDTPGDIDLRGYLGVLAARQGRADDARHISRGLEGLANPYDFGREPYWQACISAQVGELDRAVVLLRESYARGRMFIVYLHADMDLEPLHDLPSYQDFIRPKG